MDTPAPGNPRRPAVGTPKSSVCVKCGKPLTPEDQQANLAAGDGMNLCKDCRAEASVKAPPVGSD